MPLPQHFFQNVPFKHRSASGKLKNSNGTLASPQVRKASALPMNLIIIVLPSRYGNSSRLMTGLSKENDFTFLS